MTSTSQPEDVQGSLGTQGVFILCEADQTRLHVLVSEVERQLANQAATVLLYGISPKRQNGFIVVEAARGVPSIVTHWLSGDPDIWDYVIYDAPYDLLRFLREAADIGEPPSLPEPAVEQYTLLGGPVRLLGSKEERWIARVQGREGMGILIYQGLNELLFLSADESVDAIQFMWQESLGLLPQTHPELSEEHQATIEQLCALWRQAPTQAGKAEQ